MCEGTGCPLKEVCYRYKAKADPYWQSMFVEVPYKNGNCTEYWGCSTTNNPDVQKTIKAIHDEVAKQMYEKGKADSAKVINDIVENTFENDAMKIMNIKRWSKEQGNAT